MKKTDETTITDCLSAMYTAENELRLAKARLVQQVRDLAEAQCPWEPLDYVQVDVEMADDTAELYAKSYRVKSVKADHSRPNAPTWCIMVVDPVGNSYAFNSTRNLIPGEPWQAEDEPTA